VSINRQSSVRRVCQRLLHGCFFRSHVRHALESLRRFELLEAAKFREPLVLRGESPEVTLKAFIDVDDRFGATDKLSQVHALLQAENVASYPFMRKHISDGRTHLHIMWFDIYTGEIYYFSRKLKVGQSMDMVTEACSSALSPTSIDRTKMFLSFHLQHFVPITDTNYVNLLDELDYTISKVGGGGGGRGRGGGTPIPGGRGDYLLPLTMSSQVEHTAAAIFDAAAGHARAIKEGCGSGCTHSIGDQWQR
jgi:hypothetical protein